MRSRPVVEEADLVLFVANVEQLVAHPVSPSRLETEQLLTHGCALALALESGCARIEHEIAELVDRIDEPGSAERLRSLTPRLRGAQIRLARARELISVLQTTLQAQADTMV
ncbi:MAG: hypothetical protein QOK04_2450 [Solirubrobacteraceae bacterium]|jgi:hypothetical protein|nr:hypothetical protein [Solirubrobacteraceae bacterium]